MYKWLPILLIFSLSPTVSAASSVKINNGKTYIEALSLEEQTIQLHGSTYVFSKDITVLNIDGNSIGLKGLEEGLWVKFDSTSYTKDSTYREEGVGVGVITHIQVINKKSSPREE